VKPRVLDLNAAVSGTISILKRLIGEDAALVWSPGPALWAIEIDPSQLDQILANLAVNARDAMAGTGTFRIETANVVFDDAFCAGHLGAVAGEYVRLTVSDTGSGISPEIVGRIFEPFFTTKPQGLGTGLGLSTVYGIVKQNRGFVTVESEVGRGATFAIALPRARAELSEPDGGSEPTRVP
jgi:signal transduction histidine kinase